MTCELNWAKLQDFVPTCKHMNTQMYTEFKAIHVLIHNKYIYIYIQWKPLIMITLRPALFDNNNRLITLSGGYKHMHYLTQFIVTNFYMYKKQQNLF